MTISSPSDIASFNFRDYPTLVSGFCLLQIETPHKFEYNSLLKVMRVCSPSSVQAKQGPEGAELPAVEREDAWKAAKDGGGF